MHSCDARLPRSRRASTSWLRHAPWVAGALGVAALASSDARADEPSPDTLPITVVAVQTNDADDQAEALTKAVRNSVRTTPGWSLGEGDYSLEVLTLSLKCAEPPDAQCESRIADQIKADRFLWGSITKKGGNVKGELHLWVRGKGSTKIAVEYSSNLVEANDEALKKVANDAFRSLSGGPPTGTVKIKAGNVDGQVFVDGSPIGALANGEGTFPMPAGSHKIVVRAQGFSDVEGTTTVVPNKSVDVVLTPVAAEPDTPTNWRRIGGFVGIGSGLAFGAVGLYAHLKVFSLKDSSWEATRYAYGSGVDVCSDAENNAEPKKTTDPKAKGHLTLSETKDRCSTSSTMELMQAIFYPAAAIAGGVGVYLLLTSSSTSAALAKDSAWKVRPMVGPQGGKVDVSYRF